MTTETQIELNVRRTSTIDEAQAVLSRRSGFEETELSESAKAGILRVFGDSLSADEVVRRILADVQESGDEAIHHYSRVIDNVELARFEVPRDEWRLAFDSLSNELQGALAQAAAEIERFHRKQRRNSWIDVGPEGTLGQIIRPLERIGVYAPGGSAAYPSSLLMTAIPARVAGVEEIFVCSPPTGGQVSPLILAAAHVAEVDRLFQVGGAQAIGAMAYGTRSIPHVDKIYGPGNIFVVLAKRHVYGTVAIDQLPGPTETLVIADETADPRITAADLLAQAEHDAMASAILLTTSDPLADSVLDELRRQLPRLERSSIAGESLTLNGLIAVVPDLETAVSLSNAYAPEHLCLLTANPWDLVGLVKNAGGIFVGESSPEALGDYAAGPSHVMPTGGSARFFSPIHLDDFTKVISLTAANRSALERLAPATIALARAEGLTAHARAIELRIER
jgi:histidinol dehydrogenase